MRRVPPVGWRPTSSGGRWRILVLAVTAGALAPSPPAAAEVIDGERRGSLTINDDAVIVDTERSAREPIAIPSRGTVGFRGIFDEVEERDEPAEVRGELLGRHPFGTWQIAAWDDRTLTGEAQGTETYELPALLPRGSGPVALELEVVIGDDRCVIAGSARVDGDRWDGRTIGALILAVLLLAAMMIAGRRDARGHGHPLVGLLAGLLSGAAFAATLFGSAAVALDDAAWWVLPAIGAALGLLLGASAPFGSLRGPEPPEPASQ